MNNKRLPRDVLLERLLHYAKEDKDIYLLDADLGAKTLDAFRDELPGQFIHCGISEQNMIDVAAGLSLEGKKVFTFAMAPFVTLRCFEQIKVALASMNLPVTIVGNGIGYSYAPAGPTHYGTEDIGVMRSLANIEILTPSDSFTAEKTLDLCISSPKLRYIRLDRMFLPPLHNDSTCLEKGMIEVKKGRNVCIFASGYMLHEALKISKQWENRGISIGVFDLLKVKPIHGNLFNELTKHYHSVISWEEHFLSGGEGSSIAETIVDNGLNKKLRRIGIQENYYLENGDRQFLHKLAGISPENVNNAIESLLSN